MISLNGRRTLSLALALSVATGSTVALAQARTTSYSGYGTSRMQAMNQAEMGRLRARGMAELYATCSDHGQAECFEEDGRWMCTVQLRCVEDED
jgi:hypothetical protein